jgi:sulfatase maturation enzyme AslB (radical SAM superfamily)
MEVFRELETRGITYEITTNGILLDYYSEAMRALPHLTKITISIDGY